MKALIIFLCILIGGCSVPYKRSRDNNNHPSQKLYFGSQQETPEKSELNNVLAHKNKIKDIDAKILTLETELIVLRQKTSKLTKRLNLLKEKRNKEFNSLKLALGL